MTYVCAAAVLSALGGALAVLLVIAERFLADYGQCRITVNEREPFVIDGGRSLLDALYERRIFIPSACGGRGTCGFCKVQPLEGAGPLLPTELPYLTKSEIADGVRLACQVKVKKDIAVRVRPDFLNVQEFKARVTRARLVTHDTREVALRLEGPAEMDFRPGQYVQVRVPSAGQTTFRAYSISSAPHKKDEIELLVRLVPGGLGSTYLHALEAGEEVAFTGPYGEFVLDAESEIICVGGGCGMAPIRSILHHLREVSPGRPCRLFFGVRSSRDMMYLDELRELARTMPGLRVYYALSEPDHEVAWDVEVGFIHESVARHLGESGNRQVFICGPPKMIEAAMKVLKEKGVAKDRIFFDEF